VVAGLNRAGRAAILPAMAGRNPARFLAPLALVAFAVALFMVVSATSGGGDTATKDTKSAQPRPAKSSATGRKGRRKRRAYIVKAGDTPSGIAEKTGVTLEQLEAANPDLDPQLLAPGQRIKLPR
jgi:LysM repeat protein